MIFFSRAIYLSFIASFFIMGLYNFLTDYEENSCEMTYMFEWPKYLEVPLEKSIAEKFRRYKLYFYGEGKYADESSNLELRGIPVLFIPGNAGSHKQVRSLGSVALRKAESTNFHFNYFSMDFDDDFSGMSGPLLYQQTEFTHECIKKILTLYNTAANKPSSVVLVGHSMGGFVARAVFTLPKFDTTTVTTIITQATPHRAPVSSVDSYMVELYNSVNDYWTSHVNTTLIYVTVLSTGGGFRDVLVPTSLTSLTGIVPFDRGLSTSTMTTPRAWVSTDHLCHVWCKQIVLATKRAMFDMVDKNTKQIAVSPKYRMMAIHHHFGHNMGLKKMKPAFDKNIELDENIKWETRKRSSWRFSNSVSSVRYSMMPLPRDSEHGAVIMSNIENDAWVGLCLLGLKEKKCKKLENMSPYATMVPPLYSERKVLHIEPDKLLHQSHLLIILPKTKKNAVVDLTAEIYNVTARKLTYELPGMFAGLMSAALGADPDSLPPEIVINDTDHKAQFYNITVKGLDHVVSAWTAHLVVRRCASNVSTANFAGSLMKFHTPWAREDTFSFIRYGENGYLSLRLQSTRPEGASVFPELHLHLHPSCSYQVVITKDRMGALGRWAAYCAVLMPAYLVVQVIMSLSWQLKQLDEQGIAASFQFSHNRWAQPWRVGPVAMLLHFMLYFPEEASLASKVGLPADDFTLLQQKGVYFQPVPIFLYLTAYALVELFSFIAQIPFTVLGSIVFRLCGGCCQTVGFARAMRAVQCIVFTVAAVVASTTCGTLGIAIVYFTYFIKLIYEYQLARRREETLGEWAWNKFNVSFSLFLMLLMTVTLNIPSLITWVKNLRYSAVLDVDPSRSLGVSVALAALMLAFTDFPLPMTDLYGVMSGMAYISCILMLMYATDSTYRLSYFISANLLTIAIPLTLLVTIVTLTNKKQQPQVEEAEGRKEKDSDAEEEKEKDEVSKESKPEEQQEESLLTKRRARRNKNKSDE